MSGLTTYKLHDAVLGYAAHGSRYQLIGSNFTYPFHVSFQRGERIVTVWVCAGSKGWGMRQRNKTSHHFVVFIPPHPMLYPSQPS